MRLLRALGALRPVLVAAAVVLIAAVCGSARAQAGLDEADRVAIRAVIEDQLAAFRRDDGPAAFAHASPGIRAKFGNPDTFMAMVRRTYQPVYRPRDVQFHEVTMMAGLPTQKVLLVGLDGRAVFAYYTMERQKDGAWKIDGCFLSDAPGQSV
jgi:Domain of unknown function (DUF4864)